MAARIVIQHVSGSRANQTEHFALDDHAELVIGRDPNCNIVFDPEREHYISRRQAAIRITGGDRPSFRLADLGSTNSTLLNGVRVAGDAELLPGDTVELGTGGARFKFDVEPRPSHLMMRTRVAPKNLAATKVASPAEIAAATKAVGAPEPPKAAEKATVGRNTVMGMLVVQRSQTNRTWLYILAGVLVLVAAGGGGLYYQSRIKAEAAAAELAKHEAALKAQAEEARKAQEANAAALKKAQEAAAAALKKTQEENAAAVRRAQEEAAASLKKAVGMTPQDIVRKFGNATVIIDVQWRLYDSGSGLPLYHKMFTLPDIGRLPAYIQLTNGQIVRWLTTDDENQTNRIVGLRGRGTGFVIGSQGFILTNKHVAAGWQTSYGEHETYKAGILYDFTQRQAPRAFDPSKLATLVNWIPEKGPVFRVDAPVPVDARLHDFEGRSDLLQVKFPGSLVSLAARLVRTSVEADVAEIKVDSEQALSTVELSNGAPVPVGAPVTVLGYPAFSAETLALISSTEGGQPRQVAGTVPEPTVTTGNVSRISEGFHRSGAVETAGALGDLYQLTVPTGAGNSGGPVFDHDGKVIGIFTYGTRRETTTFAVPIKFALDLFKVQRAQP
jgi:S1-C subfamily serine protease